MGVGLLLGAMLSIRGVCVAGGRAGDPVVARAVVPRARTRTRVGSIPAYVACLRRTLPRGFLRFEEEKRARRRSRETFPPSVGAEVTPFCFFWHDALFFFFFLANARAETSARVASRH
jgi:hypothetical protein